MTKMATLTVPALRRAIETRDGTTLAGFYTDDAVLRIVDQMNPPSRPSEIKGRDAIAAYYDDVCTYPDGKRVYCAATLELVGGRIARQTAIQAWDE
jgi:ketosteroid isomerase-like protein